jgi:hypothetical protein
MTMRGYITASAQRHHQATHHPAAYDSAISDRGVLYAFGEHQQLSLLAIKHFTYLSIPFHTSLLPSDTRNIHSTRQIKGIGTLQALNTFGWVALLFRKHPSPWYTTAPFGSSSDQTCSCIYRRDQGVKV